MIFTEPVTLTGDRVVLEPMQLSDHDGLVDAARDGELWNLWYTGVPRPEGMRAAIDGLLADQAAGTRVPFTARRRDTGRIIGVTTLMNMDAVNRRLEIGNTWNARSTQRTGTNAESKLLLLGHAFDQLDCIAVEFRTHWHNHQSRGAIARLGAKQDGVLRSHRQPARHGGVLDHRHRMAGGPRRAASPARRLSVGVREHRHTIPAGLVRLVTGLGEG